MKTWVIDASVVVKWFLTDAESGYIYRLENT
jgi:predicted nucleic acid-binding protein